MRYEFRLPELGKDAPDRAKLSFWYKEVGDQVTEGESLCEMFTDKATFDVPSPAKGKILEILVENEHEEVEVGQVIAVMDVEG